MAFWKHFGSQAGTKLGSESEQKRVRQSDYFQELFGTGREAVLGLSLGGLGVALGQSVGGPGRP